MKKHTMYFLKSIALSLLAVPVIANAHDLGISNHTSSPLTFKVNNVCSAEIGTVYDYEIKNIQEKTLNKLCNNFKSTCEIIGYTQANCGGKPVGGIKYLNENTFEVSATGDFSVAASVNSLFFNEGLK